MLVAWPMYCCELSVNLALLALMILYFNFVCLALAIRWPLYSSVISLAIDYGRFHLDLVEIPIPIPSPQIEFVVHLAFIVVRGGCKSRILNLFITSAVKLH